MTRAVERAVREAELRYRDWNAALKESMVTVAAHRLREAQTALGEEASEREA